MSFKIKNEADIALKIYGKHNALNALGAYVLCKKLNIASHQILQAFANFKGLKRRFEIRSDLSKRFIIEDFAHHPTAVQAVIETAKRIYKDKNVLAIFEPRSATS